MVLIKVSRDAMRMSYLEAMLCGEGVEAQVRIVGGRSMLCQLFVRDDQVNEAGALLETLEADRVSGPALRM